MTAPAETIAALEAHRELISAETLTVELTLKTDDAAAEPAVEVSVA